MGFFDSIKKYLIKKYIFFKATLSKKSVDTLHPSEKKIIEQSVLKRQIEFATGRWCAKQLLKELNINSTTILSDISGAPIWPEQICGSISHTSDAFCAAISYKKYFTSIGIDIENKDRQISEDAINHFINSDEKKYKGSIEQARILFSAKESVFKLLYPITKKKFYFQDVSIILNQNKNTFDFILNKDLSNTFKIGYVGKGNFFLNEKWVFTICSIAI